MAYTIKNMLDIYGKEYKLSIIGGKNSEHINNEIEWVEIVDGKEDYMYVKSGEVVLFTARKLRGEDEILAFLSLMKEKSIAAITMVTGPWLTLSTTIMKYCKTNNIPTLVIPWDMNIHQLTKNVCRDILREQMSSFDVGQILKSMIFFPREARQHYKELEARGFDLQGNYVIYILDIHFKEDEPDNFIPDFKFYNDKFMEALKLHHGFWTYEGTTGKVYVLVVNSSKEEKLEEITNQLKKGMSKYEDINYSIGVGPKSGTINNLAQCFHKAIRTSQLANNQDLEVLCYDDMGIDKILLSVDNLDILKDYYNEMLEPLVLYDWNNKTNYVNLLKTYLECEGSVQLTAEKLYVHRNTINYQINKIKEITKMDISSLGDRFKLMLAIRIGEIIS